MLLWAWMLRPSFPREPANEWLQWGHAFVGMDASGCRDEGKTGHTLQWGHAFVGMDATEALAMGTQREVASMGPCFCGHGCAMASRWCVLRFVNCFNGAMLLWAWMLLLALFCPAEDTTLQWGHAFVGMDALQHVVVRGI